MSRALAGMAAFATVMALACAASPAMADRVPGMPYAGNWVYLTRDMSPVTVHVVRGGTSVEETRTKPVAATGVIPRAFIFVAHPYTSDQFDTLPDELWTRGLSIMITAPDGLPYSVDYRRMAAISPVKSDDGTLSSEELYRRQVVAAEERAQRIEELWIRNNTIRIGGVWNDYFLEPFKPLPMFEFQERTDEGLDVYVRGGYAHTYRDEATPGLWQVRCSEPVERSRPRHKCQYTIVLNHRVHATAMFVDFRLHGGWDFAVKRSALLRRQLCEFFECDPRWALPGS